MNAAVPIDVESAQQALQRPASGSFDARRALLACAGLLLLLLVLAAAVPIGGAVLGVGQVGLQSKVKRIAHPTGGVIAAIATSNGQHVTEGQLLMRLDDNIKRAEATYSSLSVEQLLAQRARLSAERVDAPRIVFPAELVAAGTVGARQAMADETLLFAIRRRELGQIGAQLSARMSQYTESIRGMSAQIAALERQSRLIEPERQGVKELWDKQLVTINRLNQLERTAADLEGNAASLRAQIAQTRAKIAEAREQMLQLRESRRAEAGAELARINIVLNDQVLRKVSAADQQVRSEIRAPYAGVIEKLAFWSVGDVVKPAEPIMEIVPDDDEMIVEVAVGPADIDQVRPGQRARIRFSAFNLSATPEIPGVVAYVAKDRTQDPNGSRAFYTVRVKIHHLRVAVERLELRSGMPAEVHIETGERSMLSYMTKPLRDQFARAFRDN